MGKWIGWAIVTFTLVGAAVLTTSVYFTRGLLSDWPDAEDPPLNPKLKIVAGQPCPDFEYETLDGKAVKLGDYRGKLLLVDVFSPT